MEERISDKQARDALARYIEQEVNAERVTILFTVISHLYRQPLNQAFEISMQGCSLSYRNNELLAAAMRLNIYLPGDECSGDLVRVAVPDWLEDTYQMIKKRHEEIEARRKEE